MVRLSPPIRRPAYGARSTVFLHTVIAVSTDVVRSQSGTGGASTSAVRPRPAPNGGDSLTIGAPPVSVHQTNWWLGLLPEVPRYSVVSPLSKVSSASFSAFFFCKSPGAF